MIDWFIGLLRRLDLLLWPPVFTDLPAPPPFVPPAPMPPAPSPAPPPPRPPKPPKAPKPAKPAEDEPRMFGMTVAQRRAYRAETAEATAAWEVARAPHWARHVAGEITHDEYCRLIEPATKAWSKAIKPAWLRHGGTAEH